MCLALCLCWVLFCFINFPNRKLDKSVCPQPQLIFCGVDPLSLSINMHESSWALVLNGLDPCVWVWVWVCVFVLGYIGIGWVLVRSGLYIKKLCLFHKVFLCVFMCTCWEAVFGSCAASGKLKCHDWLPVAIGLLSLHLVWLMRVMCTWFKDKQQVSHTKKWVKPFLFGSITWQGLIFSVALCYSITARSFTCTHIIIVCQLCVLKLFWSI